MVGDEFQSIYGFRHADLDVFRRQRERDRAARRRRADGAERQLPLAAGADRRRQPLRRGAARRDATGRCGSARAAAPTSRRPGAGGRAGRAAADRARRLGRGGDRAGAGDRRPHAAQLPGRGARRRRAPARAGRRRGRRAARWSCCCAPSPTSTPTRTRSSAPACGPTWSAAAATGPSSRSPTSARCWRRSPTRSTTRPCSAPSPRPPAAPPRTRSGCCGAAAGKRRHVWPRGRAGGRRRRGGAGRARAAGARSRAASWSCCGASWRRIAALRERGPRLSLAGLIEAATTETGYDLAVLMRPAGEARFANVRKLMRLAAEFEAREGRDLRGLLDFLAARAESDAEAQAATAAEGHDGVRIMTVHNAKGLEFGVVAVPDLSRSLLAGARPPLLVARARAAAAGGDAAAPARQRRDQPLRLRRALRGGARARLRGGPAPLPRRRHPRPRAADPQRRRQTRAGRETKPSTPVVERLVAALGVERDADATVAVPPPEPRPGLEASFGAVEIAVRVNLPSPERAAELTAIAPRGARRARRSASGPPPLVERRPPIVPSRPLSYTAISAYEECAYRFYMERVLGLAASSVAVLLAHSGQELRTAVSGGGDGSPSAREERTARGAAVHALLEWSQANGWAEPLDGAGAAPRGRRRARPEDDRRGREPAGAGARLARLAACASGSPRGDAGAGRGAAPARRRRHRPARLDRPPGRARGRAAAGRRLQDRPPRRLRPGRAAPRDYETQRSIYALAVAEALRADAVEVAYVFLERPEEPALAVSARRRWRPAASAWRRDRPIGRGEFPVAPSRSAAGPSAAAARRWAGSAQRPSEATD